MWYENSKETPKEAKSPDNLSIIESETRDRTKKLDANVREQYSKEISVALQSRKPLEAVCETGVQSAILREQAPSILRAIIEAKLTNSLLDETKKENIILAILDSLLTGETPVELMLKSFTGAFDGVASILKSAKDLGWQKALELIDWKSKESKKDAVGLGGLVTQLWGAVDTKLATILLPLGNENTRQKAENICDSPSLMCALFSGKKKFDEVSITEAMTPEKRLDYITSLNVKIRSLDARCIQLNDAKEWLFGFMADSKDPSSIQGKIAHSAQDLFKFFLELPIIGDILAVIMWYQSGKDMLEGFGYEVECRKSINALLPFAARINEKKERIVSEKDPGIELLKDKDLSGLSSKKLKPFFDYCKTKNIDIKDVNFWPNVFKKLGTSDPENVFILSDGTVGISQITESHFDRSGAPTREFFEALNSIHDIIPLRPNRKDDGANQKDKNDDPKALETWKQISPEMASQKILDAIKTVNSLPSTDPVIKFENNQLYLGDKLFDVKAPSFVSLKNIVIVDNQFQISYSVPVLWDKSMNISRENMVAAASVLMAGKSYMSADKRLEIRSKVS